MKHKSAQMFIDPVPKCSRPDGRFGLNESSHLVLFIQPALLLEALQPLVQMVVINSMF